MLASLVRSLCLSKSRQDLTKIQKESNFTVRSRQSWWDLANLSEIELNEIWETHKHHGKISARWMKSCRDLAEIQKLTNIMARSPQSWWDLGSLSEISAISAISMRWRIIHHNLFEIQKLQTSWKSRQGLSKNLAHVGTSTPKMTCFFVFCFVFFIYLYYCYLHCLQYKTNVVTYTTYYLCHLQY